MQVRQKSPDIMKIEEWRDRTLRARGVGQDEGYHQLDYGENPGAGIPPAGLMLIIPNRHTGSRSGQTRPEINKIEEWCDRT